MPNTHIILATLLFKNWQCKCTLRAEHSNASAYLGIVGSNHCSLISTIRASHVNTQLWGLTALLFWTLAILLHCLRIVRWNVSWNSLVWSRWFLSITWRAFWMKNREAARNRLTEWVFCKSSQCISFPLYHKPLLIDTVPFFITAKSGEVLFTLVQIELAFQSLLHMGHQTTVRID